ncbi:hypothetical protein QL285_038237 [Trifolium repens]|nr:hypothetical protein QL285_038237 [Trifolium repens]
MDGSGLHKEGSTLLQAGSTLLCAGSILLEVGSKHQQVTARLSQDTADSRRTQQDQASSPWRAPARGASFAEQGHGCCSSISSVFPQHPCSPTTSKLVFQWN